MRPPTVFASAARALTRQQSHSPIRNARELIATSRQLIKEAKESQQLKRSEHARL